MTIHVHLKVFFCNGRRILNHLIFANTPPVDKTAAPGENRRDGKLVSCLLNSKENRHFPQMCKTRNGILFMCQHPVCLLIVRLKTHMGYPPILLWRGGKENRWDVGEEKGRDPDRHWKGPAASLEDKALR